MKFNKYKIYDLVYNFHIPIIFFLFISSMIITGITDNVLYFLIGATTAIVLSLLSMYYLYVDFSKIKFWWNSLFKYKLTEKERELYNSILNKDAIGYGEWYAETHGDDICGHWIKNITEEEMSLLDKIHEHFFGKDWWIAVPICNAQVYAVMLNDIKDRIR